jgi:hypothetical protein
MTIKQILARLDNAASKIQQARAELLRMEAAQAKTRAGESAKKAVKKRVLSPEARKRIAEAQRKRWAKVKRKTMK